MNNRKKVAFIVEGKDAPQYRYRVKNVIEALKNSDKWEGCCYLKTEISEIKIDEFDLIVILRQTAKDNKIRGLIKLAKSQNVKVLFDLDDLIFDYKDLSLVKETTREKNLIYWLGYFWGIRRIAKKVDGFITTNDFLGRILKQSFNKPYKVVRNSLNSGQIEVSKKCLEKKKHEGFVIGYFSGSSTHEKDFKMVEPALDKLMKTHDDIRLRIVGDMKLSQEINKWVGLGRVLVSKKVDYLKLEDLIAGVDINIAPLVINDFTNCKSELKFFEAGVVETTTVASPSYTFERVITDDENGFLAEQEEWYDKLEYLYKNPKENARIAKNAREYVLKHYYGKEFLKEIEGAYEYFAK